MQAQVVITQRFGQQAASAVGNYANDKYNELKDTDPEEAAKWAEGGAYRVAAHAVVGGLTGGVGGALGAATSQMAIDQIGKLVAQTDLPLELKQALVAVAGAAVGATVGGTAGAACGFTATVNNYLTVADLQKKGQTKKEQQTTSLENNRRVEDACVDGTAEACGGALGKAADDIADLRTYREQLREEITQTADATHRAELAAAIQVVDSQIGSASNAIRVGLMALNGGNFDISTMTEAEIVAMGFAFDAAGAAEIKAAGRVNSLINTLINNASSTEKRTAGGGGSEISGGDDPGPIKFGAVDNQVNHTFRHIEAAGLDRQVVQAAIQADLGSVAANLPLGLYNGSVVINSVKVDYAAFRWPNGVINVGRITPPR